jgi:hypothetical protein
MDMTDIASALRRIVTGDDASGKSVIIVDGPPSSLIGSPELGGLFELWHDVQAGPLDPRATRDLGPKRPVLSPDAGHVKVRWFVIQPLPEGVPAEALNANARARFAEFDAEDHLRDQSKHPAMHQTDTLDVICLLQGDVTLILDNVETRVKPGQVVIQRGTSHAWKAHGGPALLLAVLIDRQIAGV